ncbi:MAG: hypothetical protein ACC628_24670 [Pirellulaceae bacterium]
MNAMSGLACFVFAISAICVSRAPAEEAGWLQQSMIWVESVPVGEQTYVVFRKRFELARQPATVNRRIFADSRYILWVNGQYVARGPCRFDPIQPALGTTGFAISGGTGCVTSRHSDCQRFCRSGCGQAKKW